MRSILTLILTPILILAATAALARAADGEILRREPVELGVFLAADQPERLRAIVAPLAGRVDLERITYRSDGLAVTGYLALPRAGDALPGLIFCRGGNREFGAMDDRRAAAVLAPLAGRGYAVVAPQYRGNGGGEGREEFGGADLAEVLHCIPLLESLDRVDADRLGIYGWSRGGLMTYLALASSDRFRAAVVGAGLADSFDTVERRPAMETEVYAQLVPDWSTTREAALEARSPVRWAERLCPTTPILILHGSADWRVDPGQALRMAEALLAARIPYRLVIFEGGDHGLSEHREEVGELATAWLDRFVRDGAPLPELEPHGR
jgi:dipeptidyl aminopeptidase/acylaminoacyl peptidase